MVKKKAKVAKKGKKGKEVKKTTKKQKGPSQKELFEMQVDLLQQQVAKAEDDLECSKEEMLASSVVVEEEVASKEACVEHLRRELLREGEMVLDNQEKLHTERSLQEKVERDAMDEFAQYDSNQADKKNFFLEEKVKLEGKIQLLEEVRLKRNSQRANLKMLEDALDEKIAALIQRSREEDMIKLDTLLGNREKFVSLCRELRNEWRQVFELRLPVHAEQQFRENIKLRSVCQEATKDLLQAQTRNRILKNLQTSFDLEQEMQDFVEESAEDRIASRERYLQRLLRVYKNLLTAEREEAYDFEKPSTSTKAKGEYGTDIQLHEDSEPSTSMKDRMVNVDEHRQEVIQLEEDSEANETGSRRIHQEHSNSPSESSLMSTIRRHEIEQLQLKDIRRDINVILEDQEMYEGSLEHKMEEITDKNGVKMSALLRAGNIFETRCSRVENADHVELDYDLLHQIRMLLDLCPEISEI